MYIDPHVVGATASVAEVQETARPPPRGVHNTNPHIIETLTVQSSQSVSQ